MQTIPLGVSLYPTTNTKLAATLLTLGVPFARQDAPPLSNIYSSEKPYRHGVPGTITYHLSGIDHHGRPSTELAEAYQAGTADRELDVLVSEIEAAAPELGAKLRSLLPLAIACYCRAVLENRERLIDLWRHAKPMVLVRRNSSSFVLVARDASSATLRRCGLQ